MTAVVVDGTHSQVSCTFYEGHGWRKGANVVIGGATSTPQSYYAQLAEYLSKEQGLNCYTFDYTGTGPLKPKSLAGFTCSMKEWAKDIEVVCKHAAKTGPVVFVGHSLGAQLFHICDAHLYTVGMYGYGGGANSFPNWRLSPNGAGGLVNRLVMWVYFNLVWPLLTWWFEYMPMSKVRGINAHDLPLGVFTDWRAWANDEYYLFGHAAYAAARQAVAQITVPLVLFATDDDDTCTTSCVAKWVECVPQSEAQIVNPKEYGAKGTVGHLGYVRSRGKCLWPLLTKWIDQRVATKGVMPIK